MDSSSISACDERRASPATTAWLAAQWRRDSAAYILVMALLLFTVVNAVIRNEPLLPFFKLYASRAVNAAIVMGYAGAVAIAIRALIRNNGSPLAALRANLTSVARFEMLARCLLACLVLVVLMAVFLFNKMLIPTYLPFQWDATFAAWDLYLFGGRQPWEILQPVLGYPMITAFFDFMYALWVPLVFVFWIGALAPGVPQNVRSQYWLATVVSWILIGLVLATVFSSAGPCYFDAVVPGVRSPYEGLDAYLASVAESRGLMAMDMKDFLWAVHTGRYQAPGGISAMPSMHNAQAVLFAAAAYRVDRRFGHVMAAFAGIIFIGSIHLGWHYAVDGIVAAPVALLIWWAAGAYIRAIGAGARLAPETSGAPIV